MSVSLSTYLSSSCRGKMKKEAMGDVDRSLIPAAVVTTMNQRTRDEKPMQPQRSRSKEMARARNHHSESKLGRNTAPLATPAFTRLKSDNFVYCSDFSHVGENAKNCPRPVMRKMSFGSTATTTSESSSSDCFDNEDCSRGEGTVQDPVRPSAVPPKRCLRRETSFYHKVPTRPSYHDRWTAALGSRDTRPTRLSRPVLPRSTRRHELDLSGRGQSRASQSARPLLPRSARRGELDISGRGQRRASLCGSIATTTSSITTVSTISGRTLPIEHFDDVQSIGEDSIEPSLHDDDPSSTEDISTDIEAPAVKPEDTGMQFVPSIKAAQQQSFHGRHQHQKRSSLPLYGLGRCPLQSV